MVWAEWADAITLLSPVSTAETHHDFTLTI